MTKQISVYLVL